MRYYKWLADGKPVYADGAYATPGEWQPRIEGGLVVYRKDIDMKSYEQACDDVYQYATNPERKSRAVYLYQTNAISWDVYSRVWKTIGEKPKAGREKRSCKI
jgi:hypothetical protein